MDRPSRAHALERFSSFPFWGRIDGPYNRRPRHPKGTNTRFLSTSPQQPGVHINMPLYSILKKDGSRSDFDLSSLLLDLKYTIVQPDGTPVTDSPSPAAVRSLGSGSFGVVVRAHDRLGIPRAVKLLRPSDVTIPEASNSFEQEIRLTNAKPFKNVITIMDYGHGADSEGTPFDYYASAFVEGRTLQDFIIQLRTVRPSVLTLTLFGSSAEKVGDHAGFSPIASCCRTSDAMR